MEMYPLRYTFADLSDFDSFNRQVPTGIVQDSPYDSCSPKFSCIIILHGSISQDYSVVNSRPVAVSVGCELTTFSHVLADCSGYPSFPLQFVILDQ